MTGFDFISVDELQIGMYVSKLDRPWLETPFLFQGFYVRDEDDIQAVRSHCKRVYIDRVQSAVAPAVAVTPVETVNRERPEPKRSKRRASWLQSLKDLLRRNPAVDLQATGTFYRDTSNLKDELVPATQLHQLSFVGVRDVFEDLRKNKNLDVESITAVVDPMIDSVLRNQDALACLTRMKHKDNYLYGHSLGSAVWALVLGRHLGLDRDSLQAVGLGAMLLDVGKVLLPTELLTKPGKLDQAERALVRRHVEAGIEIVKKNGAVDRRVLEMIANHHERHNGSGYPNGLSGNAIPVYGRIAGLADCYDAMITKRPYATALSSLDAMRQLRQRADVDFQAEMVDQFMQAIGAFPTGTLVELNTGEVGVVVSQNDLRRLRPSILLVLTADKELRKDFPILDLASQTKAADGQQSLWIAHGLGPGAYGIDPVKYYVG